MSRNQIFATLALIGLLPVAGSALPYQPLDECVEAAVDSTALPDSLPGQIAVTPCPDCSPVLLRIDAATRYFVGEHAVSMSMLQQYARRDGRSVRVCHDPDRNVTRLKVSGELDAADQPQ
jgi:hypothetical protein